MNKILECWFECLLFHINIDIIINSLCSIHFYHLFGHLLDLDILLILELTKIMSSIISHYVFYIYIHTKYLQWVITSFSQGLPLQVLALSRVHLSYWYTRQLYALKVRSSSSLSFISWLRNYYSSNKVGVLPSNMSSTIWGLSRTNL